MNDIVTDKFSLCTEYVNIEEIRQTLNWKRADIRKKCFTVLGGEALEQRSFRMPVLQQCSHELMNSSPQWKFAYQKQTLLIREDSYFLTVLQLIKIKRTRFCKTKYEFKTWRKSLLLNIMLGVYLLLVRVFFPVQFTAYYVISAEEMTVRQFKS